MAELTATERRVAELVATGRRNAEVAAQLGLGVKTVETHLTRIYRKLGVRSRTELAARVASGGSGGFSPRPDDPLREIQFATTTQADLCWGAGGQGGGVTMLRRFLLTALAAVAFGSSGGSGC